MKNTLLYILLAVFSTLLISAEVFKPVLEFSDCFLENCQSFKDDPRIQFAFLTVPEDHENPDGRLLKLAVVFIKSANGNPEPDPVIHLTGGPGGKALLTGRVNAFKNHPLGQNRDIILMDFRGIGFSEPAFCPEFQEALIQVITSNLTPYEATERTIKHYSDCFDKLMAEGINLSKYNSAAVVKDLEMLRIALDVEQWNLWGISYGTRVAQTYLRDFPESVRCVIMDSPVPMGYPTSGEELKSYQRSLNDFFNVCKNSPECRDAFPDLEERFYKAMNSLKENPLKFKDKNAPDGFVNYNFYNMHLIVQQLLYIPDFYPLLPWLINGIEERNKDIFQNLSPQVEGQILNYSDAMFVTVLKYDNGLILSDYYSEPNDVLHDALNYFDNVILMVKQIDFIIQDSLETLPVFSDKPSLILVGGLDPITPPFYAHILKQSLPNSFLFEFPGRGHGLTRDTECAKSISYDFLNNPRAFPASDCMAPMESNPVSWVTNMYYNPRIATLGRKIMEEKRWHLIGGVLLLALGFIVSMVAALVNLFHKLKKPLSPQIKIRNLITRLSSFLAIFLLGGLGWFMTKSANDIGPLFLMGLEKEAGPVFYLSFAVLAGTLLSCVWYFLTLRGAKLGGKVLYGLLCISLFWFSALIFQYQLFPN